jgi:predicted AAA+ superfamily ATPase
MIRFASKELDLWRGSADKKPLVIRGARQVGKTWLVRDFAARNRLNLVELNMERYPHFADLFSDNNPAETIKNDGLVKSRFCPLLSFRA